jgi:hypothetical protein
MEQGLVSARLLPEEPFTAVEGVVPDAAALASGEIKWGGDASAARARFGERRARERPDP